MLHGLSISSDAVEPRHFRYCLKDLDFQILARHRGMRINAYWLSAINISSSGLLVKGLNDNHIPIQPGDKMYLTLDIRGVVLNRPVHVDIEVIRTIPCEENENSWGMRIDNIQYHHQELFTKGISQLKGFLTPYR